MEQRYFRYIVKDICGEYTYGTLFSVTDEKDLEKNMEAAEQFGAYNKFSFIDADGNTVSFYPANCIWLKLEEVEGV